MGQDTAGWMCVHKSVIIFCFIAAHIFPVECMIRNTEKPSGVGLTPSRSPLLHTTQQFPPQLSFQTCGSNLLNPADVNGLLFFFFETIVIVWTS